MFGEYFSPPCPILTPIVFQYIPVLMARAGLGEAGANEVTQPSLSRIQTENGILIT